MGSPELRSASSYSRLGIGVAVLFLAGFGIAFLLRGWSLFNPGQVTAISKAGVTYGGFSSHAAFENQCSLCHNPLQGNQNTLCIQCHTEIAAEIKGGQGLHAGLVSNQVCSSCHQEHQGRDFNPIQNALLAFDHNLTSFPLSGKHGTIPCADCHANNIYNQAQTSCVSCHSEPVQHAGMFGLDCANCHNSNAWTPATVNGAGYNHETTGFSLALHTKGYDGQPLACTACHTSTDMSHFDQSPCASCHNQHDPTFMQAHLVQYGPDCTTCHDGVDRMHNFSHDAFFTLDGAHAALQCTQCHANYQYRYTATACSACHQEPATHAGIFGLQCAACHTTQAWEPAMLQAHSFPLNHGVTTGQVTCQTCHPTTYADYTCYSCHDHQVDEIKQSHAQVGISGDALTACDTCHLDGQVHQAKTP